MLLASSLITAPQTVRYIISSLSLPLGRVSARLVLPLFISKAAAFFLFLFSVLDRFFFTRILLDDKMALPHKLHMVRSVRMCFCFSKNALSILAFSSNGDGQKFVWQQTELCVFRAQLRLRTFYFMEEIIPCQKRD